MQDGLSQENFLVGSIFAQTLSGTQFAVGAGEVGFAELGDNAVSGTKIGTGGIGTIEKIFAGALDGDQGTLSSGSRWTSFRSAFAAPPFVAVSFDLNAKLANAGDANWIGVGSIAAGSFLTLGSPASYVFNWVAIGSR